MKTKTMVGLAAASGILLSHATAHATFATAVLDYDAGIGFADGFTNSAAALGAPTMRLSYGPVDPFNPPFADTELVSVGKGGLLTLEFDTPIPNSLLSPWGIDFVVFGNEGFMDTNWPAGQTDGKLFNQAFGTPGLSCVLASEDGISFFELRPPTSISAAVDMLFPADSSGIIGLPVDPRLSNEDFAGLDLAGIRGLYAGSAGGAGFDLQWAIDNSGQSVRLDSARQLRIEVTDGKVEVDAVSVVPEPTGLMSIGLLALLVYRTRQPRM
jgi:hypothetical protein